jgi:hypothetical protein
MPGPQGGILIILVQKKGLGKIKRNFDQKV